MLLRSIFVLLTICESIDPPGQLRGLVTGLTRRLASFHVSQKMQLEVLNTGDVRAELDITYSIDPGDEMSYGFKSILQKPASLHSLSVVDQHGVTLSHSTSDDAEYHMVKFEFSGRQTGTYKVTIRYSIRSLVCTETSNGDLRLAMPWMDKWEVPVDSSQYILRFENPRSSMGGVCLHAEDGPPICSNSGDVTRNSFLNSPAFTWPQYLTDNIRPDTCEAMGFDNGFPVWMILIPIGLGLCGIGGIAFCCMFVCKGNGGGHGFGGSHGGGGGGGGGGG